VGRNRGKQTLKGHDYLVLDKKEIDSAKTMSTKLIELDKFANFFQADPRYFRRTWLLITNSSEKPYALLRKLLERTGRAAPPHGPAFSQA